jgi:hypothetical protein
MIVYNVTTNIEDSVHLDWLHWMKTAHIPDVMRTGMFTEFRFLKVLSDDEGGGHTYSVQYTCESLEKCQQYIDIYAPALRADAINRYGEKFLAFRTMLEVVE